MATVNKIILPNGNEYDIEVQTQNINGILPFSKGGTNATTPSGARDNLGLGTAAVKNTTNSISSKTQLLPTSSAVINYVEGKGYLTEEQARGIFDPQAEDDVVQVYPIAGATELSANWLSKTQGGEPLTPRQGVLYILLQGTNSNTYLINTQFRWNGSSYVKMSSSQGGGDIESISNLDIQNICT